jgi:hypothetical protein
MSPKRPDKPSAHESNQDRRPSIGFELEPEDRVWVGQDRSPSSDEEIEARFAEFDEMDREIFGPEAALRAIALEVIRKHPDPDTSVETRVDNVLTGLLGRDVGYGRKALASDEQALAVMGREWLLDHFGFTGQKRHTSELCRIALREIRSPNAYVEDENQTEIRRLRDKFNERKDRFVRLASREMDDDVQHWKAAIRQLLHLLNQLGIKTAS